MPFDERTLTIASTIMRKNYVFLSTVFVGAFAFEMYVQPQIEMLEVQAI